MTDLSELLTQHYGPNKSNALTDAFDGNAILPTLLAHKIYEVLAEKYTLRSKWAKNQSVESSPKPRPRAG